MSTKNKALLIYGCGGHARSVANTAIKNAFTEIAFVDANAQENERILGFSVYPKLPENYGNLFSHIILGMGDNHSRAHFFAELQILSLDWTSLVARTVSMGEQVTLGKGNFVGEYAYLGPEVKIGDNNILNTRAIIEHECVIGSHNHIAINATLAGRSQIGDHVMIGAGATVIDGVKIASHVVVGAGAVVVKDITEPGTYVGVPAKKVH